jgi:hypothetical protein
MFLIIMGFLNSIFTRQRLSMRNLRPPEGGAGIKYIRIRNSSRLRDDCLFFSGPWYPTPWGWHSVIDGIVHYKVDSQGNMNVHDYMCNEADGIFFDKFVYHEGTFVEYGVSYEKFYLFTFYPDSRVHTDYLISEKYRVSDTGIRGEPRPLYMVANPYIVESSNAIFISTGWLGEAFLSKNQVLVDGVIRRSEDYEPIEIENSYSAINPILKHPRYYKI